MYMLPNKFFTISLSFALFALLFASCGRKTSVQPVQDLSQQQIDSMHFAATHHYSFNDNFIVSADSLVLVRQQPEETVNELPVDSFAVSHGNHLVVADIRTIPTDSIDSIWVQVATETSEFGWSREQTLLKHCAPDDPISIFIKTFSNKRLRYGVITLVLIAAIYLFRRLRHRNIPIVHLNDIPSFYPALLALLVAFTATLYASIQLFAAEQWQEFYFHPTLNPFGQPTILALFLVCVWAIIIVAIAAVDVVRKRLPLEDAILYLCQLAAICAINYLVFSLTTLVFVGYFLLIAYVVFAIRQYLRNDRPRYLCGNCGAPMTKKGVCPHCGAKNA